MIKDIFQLQNPWRENKEYTFNLIEREILPTISDNLDNELLLGLIGSRQVGKSSILYLLIESLLKKKVDSSDIFYFNLDDFKLHELFTSMTSFIQFIGNGNRKYVFIDEIQRLESPGLFLKEVFDLNRDIKIIFSGSSQLEIKAKVKEHLVGRARIFHINRLSFSEYLLFAKPITNKDAINSMLLYGSYPAVAKANGELEKKLRIKDIFQSYIQKDLIDFLNLQKVDSYNKLLVLLSNQIGDLLNVNSLSNSITVSRNEIEKYLNILEQTFICKRIFPFHKNYNKEVTKTPKIFFLDLGLRNFILNNFNSLEIRNDKGSLMENFYLNELLAKDHYSLNKINYWRTTNQTEIDFIVQNDNQLEAIEVKLSKSALPKAFSSFQNIYPEAITKLVTINDYLHNM